MMIYGLKKIKKLVAILVPTALLFLIVIFLNPLSSFATISNGMLASDVIGQQGSFITQVNNNPSLGADSLSSPRGIVVDTVNHRLFVADSGNIRVLVYNLDGTNALVDATADYVIGIDDFENVGGGLSDIRFANVYGLDFDSVNNRLFVADGANNRVLVFDTNTLITNEIAVYVLGQPDFVTNTSGVESGMNNPTDVAYDSNNNRLFVADTLNNRVTVFELDSISNGMSPSGVIGQVDLYNNGSGLGADVLTGPNGVEYDATSDRLFVSDTDNNRVLVFNVSVVSNGQSAIAVLGQPDMGNNIDAISQSGLHNPIGMSYDSNSQRLFVSDTGNRRVVVFDVYDTTNGEDAVNVIGQVDFTTQDNSATQINTNQPRGVAYDGVGGHLYVSDTGHNRIMVFDEVFVSPAVISTTAYTTDGTYRDGDTIYIQVVFNTLVNVTGTPRIQLETGSTDRYANYMAGSGSNTLTFAYTVIEGDETSDLDYVSANSLGLNSGSIVAVDSNLSADLTLDNIAGQYSLAEQKNIVIDTTPIATIYDGMNASDVLGQVNYTNGGNKNPINDFYMVEAHGVAIDTVHHRLFVSDGNNRVLVFNLHTSNVLIDRTADYVLGQSNFTEQHESLTQNGMSKPYGIAYDSNGDRLFVADRSNSRILVYDTTSISNGESAVHVLGQPDFVSNNSSTTQSSVYEPISVTFDISENRLFVSDSSNNRVLVFDTASIEDGEDAINVLGQPDFNSNDGKTTIYGFNYPADISYDSLNDRLFISDLNNNRVLVFDTASIEDGEDAINVLGQESFETSSPNTGQNRMDTPYGITYDSNYSRLFISDTGNNRILVFDVSSITNAEDAINVLGQPDFQSTSNSASQDSLYNPFQLDYDTLSGQLFVADQKNHRVLMFRGLDTSILVSSLNSYTANGTYRDGDNIYIKVIFNGSVTVTGTPRILLEVGETDRYANYYSGSGTNTLTFIYTVVDGDTTGENDLEYVDTDSFELHGGTILGTLTSEVVGITLPVPGETNSLSKNTEIIIDTDPPANMYNGMNASDVLGGSDYSSLFADGSLGGMNNPSDVALDTVHHRMFVADAKHERVLVFNLNTNNVPIDRIPDYILGEGSESFNANNFSSPNSLAYDSTTDRLFVGDSKHARVLVFDTTTIVDYEDAVNVLGQPDFVTQLEPHTPTDSVLAFVGGLALDSVTHLLFVSDSSNNRVLVFNVSFITNGEAAVSVLGQNTFAENNPNTNSNGISGPLGIAIDTTNHRLFVADQGNNRTLVFNVSSITNGEDAVNVLGQGDFISNRPLSDASTITPLGLTYDANHDQLFISDGGMHRILVFDVSSITNGEDAINVLGQSNFVSIEAGFSQFGFSNPSRITYVSDIDQLFVADSGNNRVVMYRGLAPQTNVTNVTSSTLDGIYSIGNDISIQVIFNRIVDVIGNPVLSLETGVTDQNAIYVSGTGTSILNFLYSVISGDSTSDLSYQSTDSLSISGGSIKDSYSNDASLRLPEIGNSGSLSDNKNIIIDTIDPTVSLITSSISNGIYTQNDLITVRVLFTEQVFVTGTPQLTLETGTTDRVLDYQSGSGGTSLNFSYTVQAGDYSPDLDYKNTTALSFNGGTILDSAGNAAVLTLFAPGTTYSLSFNKNIAVDARPLGVPYIFPVASSVTTGTANSVCNYGDFFSSTTGTPCNGIHNLTPTPQPATPTKTCPILPSIPPILKLSLVHPNVKVLQQNLNCKGYFITKSGPGAPGEETAKFGALTKKAIIRFQKAHSLTQDGIVGPATRRELNK